jgi:hypothetical protein
MTRLEELEAELRSVVESRRYLEVERLVVAYCEAARSYVGTLAPGDLTIHETGRAIQGVLEWTSRMLQAGRESIALDLSRLPRVKRYLQTPPDGGSGLQVEG